MYKNFTRLYRKIILTYIPFIYSASHAEISYIPLHMYKKCLIRVESNIKETHLHEMKKIIRCEQDKYLLCLQSFSL